MPATDAANGAPPSHPDRLNGWKEIAAYFRKGVRTVQRWEADLAMPVHRMGVGRGETLYAFIDELERWRETAEAVRAERAAENQQRDETSAPPAALEPARDEEPRAAPRRLLAWRVALSALIFITAVSAAALLWMRLGGFRVSDQPASWRIVNNALAIYDADGRFLWQHQFEFRLTEATYYTQGATRDVGYAPVAIHDIDGDGRAEVLFVAEPFTAGIQGLYCFTHRGALRFRRVPDRVVKYGEKTYSPPWRGCFVCVTGATGEPHDIWFVSTHLEEFPTVVEKLDSSGNLKGEYWSNGQVTAVVTGVLSERPVVFVGAISNEFKGGSLAVLDARQPTGAAPTASDHYRCAGCPPGTPLAFLVFPRLEVSAAIGGYSYIANIHVDTLGQLMVNVRHGVGQSVPHELRTAATSHYTLDRQFRVTVAELGERLRHVHLALERSGRLDHPFSVERDTRQLWPALRWDGTAFVEVPGPEGRK